MNVPRDGVEQVGDVMMVVWGRLIGSFSFGLDGA